MQTMRINDGDRIRIVVLNVNTMAGDSTNVTLRYGWTGFNPDHMCVAEVCELCGDEAVKIAARRFVANGSTAREMAEVISTTGSIELLRDAQSTAKPRSERSARRS